MLSKVNQLLWWYTSIQLFLPAYLLHGYHNVSTILYFVDAISTFHIINYLNNQLVIFSNINAILTLSMLLYILLNSKFKNKLNCKINT